MTKLRDPRFREIGKLAMDAGREISRRIEEDA